MARSSRAPRPTATRWLLRQLPALLLPALFVGGAFVVIRRERTAGEQAVRAEQAASAAQAAAWNARAARGDMAAALASCTESWRDQLSLHHRPVALAYTRQELTAYFVEGADRSSVRQVRCGAQGVARGPRFVHPLAGLLPAEAPASGDDEDASPELLRLASRTLDPADVAIELLAQPLGGGVLVRRWHTGPRGIELALEPAGARPFPMLASSAELNGTAPVPAALHGALAPAALRPLTRHHWLAQPDAAFALLASRMPAGARVSELTLEDDTIELEIESPTPAFDGRPDAPFGDRSFDEYGIAGTDWWYPREGGGFGCRSGQRLPAVRAAFETARARLPGRPLSRAWYSCSSAYGDGRTGAWHLQAR